MVFFRLSFVSFCLLLDMMFLYMPKNLSTSMLPVEQYLNMAMSPGPCALGKVAGSPRDHSCNGLDAFKPRVLLQHIIQLDLQLDLAIDDVLLRVLEWVILSTVELTEPLQSSLRKTFSLADKNNSTLTPSNFYFCYLSTKLFFLSFLLCVACDQNKNSTKNLEI